MLSTEDRNLLLKKIQNYLTLTENSTRLLELEDKIISFQDADLSLYWVRNISSSKVEMHKDIICSLQDPEKMWLLLKDVHMKKSSMRAVALSILATNNEVYIAKLLNKGLAKRLKMEGSVVEWLSSYGSKDLIYQTIIENPELDQLYRKKLILNIYLKLTEEERANLRAQIPSVLDDIEKGLKKEQAYDEIVSLVNVLVPKESN